ncbi:bromodomain-containing protein 8-like isoform X3 [Porites lutea]|uniref:bromodomain-containing protein 8-like isoform X3 n=1 Tax=Porites lutea TaxID=51062 RepID=UPI003CC6382C
MAASMLSQKHKLPPGQNPDEWTIREKLTLASSVVRSGDQNWVSVSRTIKPILETGCCAKQRPPDFFSQKNCASHYSEMLEKVNTPKRKRTTEGGGTETPGDQIVRKLTFERIEELKKSIRNDQLTYKKLKDRIEDIRGGKLDHQLPALWDEIKLRKKMRPPPIPHQDGDGPASVTPTTPTTPITPTTHGGQSVMQQGAPKPPGSQQMTSPQKGKQLRVPKPTAKFQKYQQQLQQKHGHSSQSSPLNQTAEGLASTSELSPGDGRRFSLGHAGVPVGGVGQAGTFSGGAQVSKGEPMDVDVGSIVLSGAQRDMAPPQEPERRSSVSGQGAQAASSPSQAAGSQQTSNSQNSDGKHFLGVTPSMESTKKLDSMREIQGNITQVSATAPAAAPSVSAPTLSKLLAAETPAAAAASLNAITSHGGAITKTTGRVEGRVLESTGNPVESAVSVIGGGRGSAEGSQSVLTVSTSMPSISVNPKAAALTATLPSPLAITPPPTTPPADRKEMITDKFEPKMKNAEKISGAEITSVSLENEANSERASVDQSGTVPEVRVETTDTPVTSPRVSKRASKPGRPGRPPRAARRNQRNRSKSATSTDNEGDIEEEHEEESKFESVEVESEKTEEEEDNESIVEEKKEESDEEMERESGEEAVSDSGDRNQSEKDEPVTSMKDFLMERSGIGGSESVPGSPASQVSQGSSDEQEAIQAQKTWKKSIMLVWRAAANHKYANVFLHPVTDDEAPGYHSIVFRPMDLSSIKKNIENGTIRTTSEFQRDMMLMFQNALMYNSADHDVYRMAEEMRDDVMEQIQSYIATQIMVDSKMLRGHRQDVFHIFL